MKILWGSIKFNLINTFFWLWIGYAFMDFPRVWNSSVYPLWNLLKQWNLPAFLRHCSDSICNRHPNRTNLRIESIAVKIILKKCFRILEFTRAVSEAPHSICKPIPQGSLDVNTCTIKINIQKICWFNWSFQNKDGFSGHFSKLCWCHLVELVHFHLPKEQD